MTVAVLYVILNPYLFKDKKDDVAFTSQKFTDVLQGNIRMGICKTF